MKRRLILILFISVLIFYPMSLKAAVSLKFSCSYNVRYGDGKSTFPLKIEVYNNGTSKFYNATGKEIKSGEELVTNSKGSTFGGVMLSFDSKDFAKQATKNSVDSCPAISLNQNNALYYTILNYDAGNQNSIFVTNKVSPVYPSKSKNSNTKKVTKACNINISSLESTPFTAVIEFKMYNDGEKEFCLVQNSQSSCATVYNDKEVSNLNFQSGTQYYFRIYKNQVSKIFSQGNRNMINNNMFECPSKVYVYYDTQSEVGEQIYYITTSKKEADESSNETISPEVKEGEASENNGVYIEGEEVTGCEVVPEVIRKWIKLALNLVKYIALALVIVLGTIDFIKASASGEADAMKKAGQTFVKRIIAVIILFLVPLLVELILNLINLYGANSDCFDVVG